MTTLCQHCGLNTRTLCPIDWTREIMLDVPWWDCPHHVDPDIEPDESAAERALRYKKRHVRRKGRKV